MATWWRQYCRQGDEVRVSALTRDVDIETLRSNCLRIFETVCKHSLGQTLRKSDEGCAIWQEFDCYPKHEILLSDESLVWFGFAPPIASRMQGTFVVGYRYHFFTPQVIEKISRDILDPSLPFLLGSLLDEGNTSSDSLNARNFLTEDDKSASQRFLTDSSATFQVANDTSLGLHEHIGLIIYAWTKATASMLDKKQLQIRWLGVKQGRCTTAVTGFDVDADIPVDKIPH